MRRGSRFTVDMGRERLVVCDRRPPLVDGEPASCRWGAPGLWRTVRIGDGVRAVFELPRPQEIEPDPLAVASQRRLRRARHRGFGLDRLLESLTNALGTGGSRGPSEPVENRGTPGTPASTGSTPPLPPGAGPVLAEAALDWAMATADGELSAEARRAWTPDRAVEAAALATDGGGRWLPVRTGPVECRLLWREGRLAVVTPVITEVPARLSAARRAWAESLCLEARSGWVLARALLRTRDVPSRGRAAACVGAEVDLSGAPPALIPRLAVEARAALAILADRLADRLELVLDTRLESRLLTRRPAVPRAAPLPSTTDPGEVPGPASSLRPRQISMPW